MCRRFGGIKGAKKEQSFIIFSMEREMKNINWEEDFFVHHRTVLAGRE